MTFEALNTRLKSNNINNNNDDNDNNNSNDKRCSTYRKAIKLAISYEPMINHLLGDIRRNYVID
jgi:hypothetical protein